MFSKSMSERSAPHHGIGRAWKCFSAFSRYFRIQSGSSLRPLISSTTFSDRPLFGWKTACEGSFQSKRYPLESSLRCSSWLTAMISPPTAAEIRAGGIDLGVNEPGPVVWPPQRRRLERTVEREPGRIRDCPLDQEIRASALPQKIEGGECGERPLGLPISLSLGATDPSQRPTRGGRQILHRFESRCEPRHADNARQRVRSVAFDSVR